MYEICHWNDSIHCAIWRKCYLLASSTLPTIFSGVFFPRVIKNKGMREKDLRSVCKDSNLTSNLVLLDLDTNQYLCEVMTAY